MKYDIPAYVMVEKAIINKIHNREFLPGEAIPSERKMADEFNVNRMTVKRAVEELEKAGYVKKRAGAGTFVTKSKNQKIDVNYADVAQNTGITATFKRVGRTVNSKVFGKGIVEESRYLCHRLGMKTIGPVWGLHRVRCTEDIPFAVEYTYLPYEMFQDADNFDYSKVSLYDYMDTKNHMPYHFVQRLVVCEANEKIADLLQVEQGTAIFKIEYQGADEDYNIVEYTKSYLNPMYSEFSFDIDNGKG